MPELPDVEIYKRYIDRNAINKSIDHVEIKDQSIVKPAAQTLRDKLKGKEFKNSMRIGKNLFVECTDDVWIIFHFGMTGFLEYFKVNGEPPKYSKVLFHFSNDHILSFINKRKLGFIDVSDNPDSWIKEKKLGKDALAINLSEFREIVKHKKSKIKSALMDQKAIAGIGNIYADEILYQAGIHPERKTADLGDEDIKEIHNWIGQVNETAINNNAKPSNMPSHYLIHYRDEGENCPECSGKVKMKKISGRSTYFCEDCQN